MSDIPAYIVMPNNTPTVKKAAVIGYGRACYILRPDSLQAREAALSDIVARTGASVIHPYDDARVISGQAHTRLTNFSCRYLIWKW